MIRHKHAFLSLNNTLAGSYRRCLQPEPCIMRSLPLTTAIGGGVIHKWRLRFANNRLFFSSRKVQRWCGFRQSGDIKLAHLYSSLITTYLALDPMRMCYVFEGSICMFYIACDTDRPHVYAVFEGSICCFILNVNALWNWCINLFQC